MILHLDGRGHTLLDRAPVVVAEARAHVSHPRRDHPAHASRPDELVEQHVRDGADESQVPSPLADQLVAGRERDQGLDGGVQADRRAVGDEAGDGFPHGDELGRRHAIILTSGSLRPAARLAGTRAAPSTRASRRDDESFTLRGQGQPAVEGMQGPPLRMPLGPVEGGAELERVGRAERMKPQQSGRKAT